MTKIEHNYSWAIIGAGPAGLAALGILLEQGENPENILWIDPDFKAGDLGQRWGEVSSNTTVQLFHEFLYGIKPFEYDKKDQAFTLDTLPEQGFTLLKHVAEPLTWITHQLQQKIDSQQSKVLSLQTKQNRWELKLSNGITATANKVILATGSEQKNLSYSTPEEIRLATALNPQKLQQSCAPTNTVAVFGSSHSAMIILRNLVELGVKRIINFYRSPIRYAVPMQDWILYDNTGLKGETAQWVRANLTNTPSIERYVSNEENLNNYLPHCDKAIYAVGFKQRSIEIEGVKLSDYDQNTGIIAPGLFGAGVAFPQLIRDPLGNEELNVGLWKFMNDLRKVMPIWRQYAL